MLVGDFPFPGLSGEDIGAVVMLSLVRGAGFGFDADRFVGQHKTQRIAYFPGENLAVENALDSLVLGDHALVILDPGVKRGAAIVKHYDLLSAVKRRDFFRGAADNLVDFFQDVRQGGRIRRIGFPWNTEGEKTQNENEEPHRESLHEPTSAFVNLM
jgi:hypothetical protein